MDRTTPRGQIFELHEMWESDPTMASLIELRQTTLSDDDAAPTLSNVTQLFVPTMRYPQVGHRTSDHGVAQTSPLSISSLRRSETIHHHRGGSWSFRRRCATTPSPRDPQHLTLRRVSALALLPPETCADLMAEEVAADRAGKEADAAEAKQMLDEVREQGHDEARRRRGAWYDGLWRVMTTRARASARNERCVILQYSKV